jgi:hypothetical protein
MYCSSCGKSIPENSIFCMFCGFKMNIASGNPVVPSEKSSSIGIKELGWQFHGEIERKGSDIKRKIRLYFKLVDKNNNPVSFEGNLR